MEVRPEGRLKSDVWSQERGTHYSLVAFDIEPQGVHRDFVNKILNKASQHSANTRDTGGEERDKVTLSKTRYLGDLAEDLIADYLRTIFGQGIRVFNRRFERYETHVDIEIYVGENKTDLEVRSSFGHARMHNLIDKYFDHIGPYTTSYKSDETPKEFYLRGLINKDPRDFDYGREHTFYFAGGALYQSIEERGKIKRGRKMVEIDIETAEGLLASGNETVYRTLELWKGKDAVEIIDEIKGFIGAV